MFFQPPEKESINSDLAFASIANNPSTSGALKSARRKRKKKAQKYKAKKQALKKEKQRFANTMSSWASNFTMAATWQLKHELAYWRSKARTLQYENKILCDLLRQYHANGKVSQNNERNADNKAMSVKSDTEDDVGKENIEDEDETEDVEEGTEDYEEEEETEDVEEEEETEEGDDNIEISEEFLEFLKGNAEFRMERAERERLRKLEEEAPMKKLESCPDAPTDKKMEYEKLYGEKWQRIAALEMHLQSKFMTDCDKDKPLVWPNVALRL